MSSPKTDLNKSSDGVNLGPLAVTSGHETRDLKGTTSARARRMSMEERNLVLLKRKLRNRASAVRSRKRRLEIIETLYNQLIELSHLASRLEERIQVLERLGLTTLQDSCVNLSNKKTLDSVSFGNDSSMKEPWILLFDASSFLEKGSADWPASLCDSELENYFNFDISCS